MQLRALLLGIGLLLSACSSPFMHMDQEKERYQVLCKPRGVLGLMGYRMDNAVHCTKGYTPP